MVGRGPRDNEILTCHICGRVKTKLKGEKAGVNAFYQEHDRLAKHDYSFSPVPEMWNVKMEKYECHVTFVSILSHLWHPLQYINSSYYIPQIWSHIYNYSFILWVTFI